MWNYSKKSMPNHYAEDSKSQTTCWDVQTFDDHTMLQLISPGRKNQFLWSYKPDWGLKIFMVPHLMFILSYNWLVQGEKINSLTIHIWCEEEEKHNLIWQKKIDYGPICCFAQFDVQTRSLQNELDWKGSHNAMLLQRPFPELYNQEYFESINQVSHDYKHMMPDKLLLIPHYYYY